MCRKLLKSYYIVTQNIHFQLLRNIYVYIRFVLKLQIMYALLHVIDKDQTRTLIESFKASQLQIAWLGIQNFKLINYNEHYDYLPSKNRLTLNLPIGGFELFTLDSKRKCTNDEKYEI